jgi:hypothetical protein
MKSIIIILIAALLCGNSALVQKNEVPSDIKMVFSKKYPSATKIKWEKEGSKYETSFLLNGKEMSVLFDLYGAIEETETKIAISELPAKAKNYAILKGSIKEAARMVAANGKVTYEAEVKGRDLIFDDKGNFLEEKVDKDEDKD